MDIFEPEDNINNDSQTPIVKKKKTDKEFFSKTTEKFMDEIAQEQDQPEFMLQISEESGVDESKLATLLDDIGTTPGMWDHLVSQDR